METSLEKYLDDKAVLLDVFPEELWLNIFDSMHDPKTLLNSFKSSPYFEELLESRKTLFLFLQVLEILGQKKFLTNENFQILLNCRLVCKNWKTSVDQFLETRPYQSEFIDPKVYVVGYIRRRLTQANHKFYDDPAYPTWFDVYKFHVDKLENEILPRLQCADFQNRCPTPSRHMEIFECGPRQHLLLELKGTSRSKFNRYRTVTVKILEAVGTQFWHARIHISVYLDLTEWYTWIRKYVELMPNLETLYIMPPQTEFSEMEQQTLALKKIADQLPFPHLKHLKHVSLERSPIVVTNNILAENKHVKTIEIRDSYYYDFPRLKIKERLYPSNFNISVQTCKELAEIPKYWKLEKLRLDTVDFPMSDKLPWDIVFRKVECYKRTLVELELLLRPYYDWRPEKSPNVKISKFPLDLPKLKRLKVRTDDKYYIDFLMGLKSLEFLEVRGGWKVGRCIDLDSKRLENVKSSNIWKLLPKLRQLEIQLDKDQPKQSFQRW